MNAERAPSSISDLQSLLGRIRPDVFVPLIVLLLGLVASIILYAGDSYALLYYGDVMSHSVEARMLVDWRDPGLQQLSGFWLPIPHLLLLPFVLVDFLFASGFAGLAVSLPSLALTALLIYRIADIPLHAGVRFVPLIAAALHVSNPNTLYLGLIAMSEAPFMLFVTASAYFVMRWSARPEHLRNLMFASTAVALASLSRYEGWSIPFFIVPYATYLVLRSPQRIGWKIRGISAAVLSCAGIVAWLVLNEVRYGNALSFANVEFYSAAAQVAVRPYRAQLYLQPLNVLWRYLSISSLYYGIPLLLAAAAGVVILLRTRKVVRPFPPLYILALPILFTLASLFFGSAELAEWSNSRYVTVASPLLCLLAAVAIEALAIRPGIRARNVLVGGLLILFAAPLALVVQRTVVVYREGKGGFDYKMTPHAIRTGEILGALYDGGGIEMATGSAQEHRIMVPSKINLREFDELIASSRWKTSYVKPWEEGRWMVIAKEPDPDAKDVFEEWKMRGINMSDHYAVAYDDEFYQILKRCADIP